MDEIVNKVEKSGLLSMDLADFEVVGECVAFDLGAFLDEGIILREKAFRQSLKTHDWQLYADRHVAVGCSADAIVQNWAYMLVAAYLQPVAKTVWFGTQDDLEQHLIYKNIHGIKLSDFVDAKVVVKGCSQMSHQNFAFTLLTTHLMPVVSSIMFGEPCSTVPIYKRKR